MFSVWTTLGFDFVCRGAKFKFKIFDSYEYFNGFGNGECVGNSAMNALRYWQRRNECPTLLETAQQTPSGLLRMNLLLARSISLAVHFIYNKYSCIVGTQ